MIAIFEDHGLLRKGRELTKLWGQRGGGLVLNIVKADAALSDSLITGVMILSKNGQIIGDTKFVYVFDDEAEMAKICKSLAQGTSFTPDVR